ncbi:GSCFA domain-containing protein [uncultured Microscilla sp.]|uniref:GSCFA domain-containing protein n=1 Tax=uncultured Microscilla sp. TaxID=432653 RepID=UPI0026153822|nr:GSCFA domain-containing protein [uncultured Microscilla sp.]
MDHFRTTFNIAPKPLDIDLHTPVFSIGSCFANAMGQRLQQNKFTACVNPFGVIFNPLSIFKLINASLLHEKAAELMSDAAMVEQQGVWYHYDVHSDFYANNATALRQKLQHTLDITQQFLQNTQVVILTLGTAYGYFLKEHRSIVANCHKVPQQFFDKRLLTVEEVTQGFEQTYQALQSINAHLQVIVTVSPVRHIKDTIPLNQVSKATLRLACHQISEKFAQVAYFPAYELLLDDLRDYRFFKADMIHPTPVAEDYIWQKFTQAFMNEQTLAFLKQWGKVRQALNHRSFQPESAAHQKFLRKLLAQLESHAQTVDVSAEIASVQTQLQ